MSKIFFVLLSLLGSFVVLSTEVRAASVTYYADAFEWWNTANGDTFSQENFSAAACGYPLGNFLYTYTGSTGVTSILNDRPNCTRYPDVVDLSRSAFEKLVPLSAWRINNINTTIVGTTAWVKIPKRIFAQNQFEKFWVVLDAPLSNMNFAGEGIRIRGRIMTTSPYVLVYLNRTDGVREAISFVRKVSWNGNFDISLKLPDTAWEYYFVLSQGTSFQTEKAPIMQLISRDTLMYPAIATPVLKKQNPLVTAGENGAFFNLWNTSSFGELSIVQDGKAFTRFGQVIPLGNLNVSRWTAVVNFTGYTLSTSSSLDRSPVPISLYTGTVLIDRVYDTIGKEKVIIQKNSRMATLRFRLSENEKIRKNYYVTYPDGSVKEFSFPDTFMEKDGFLKTGISHRFSVPLSTPGTYKVEAVNAQGYAYFNIPITHGSVWNIVDVTASLDTKPNKNGVIVQKGVLTALNRLRASHDLGLLSLDDELTSLAQKKAENMAKNWYVWHWTPDGKNIVQFASSVGISLKWPIGENVAGGNVSAALLQDGLEESGSHRLTMLNPEYTNVWIGYVLQENKVYLVQVFSE